MGPPPGEFDPLGDNWYICSVKEHVRGAPAVPGQRLTASHRRYFMPTILQNHYVLAVHDLGASSEFFQKLGFAVVLEPEGWVFVKRDNCMVMLGDCRDSLPASSLGDRSYFG